MGQRRRYNITVEDESRLEKILQYNVSPLSIWLLLTGIVVFIAILGAFLFAVLPVKSLLPGYITEKERNSIEEQNYRLDSLINAYEINSLYLSNLETVLNTERNVNATISPDSVDIVKNIYGDSLLEASSSEKEFVSAFRDRELIDGSIYAPAAAESIIFSPVSEESIVSPLSPDGTTLITLSKGSYIGNIADGVVLAVNRSFNSNEKTSVIIQHPKGFVSRYSRLETAMVKPGDHVIAGEAIAPPFSNNSGENPIIVFELWHNGNRLDPKDYILPSKTEDNPIVDKDIGRGRI